MPLPAPTSRIVGCATPARSQRSSARERWLTRASISSRVKSSWSAASANVRHSVRSASTPAVMRRMGRLWLSGGLVERASGTPSAEHTAASAGSSSPESRASAEASRRGASATRAASLLSTRAEEIRDIQRGEQKLGERRSPKDTMLIRQDDAKACERLPTSGHCNAQNNSTKPHTHTHTANNKGELWNMMCMRRGPCGARGAPVLCAGLAKLPGVWPPATRVSPVCGTT